MENSGLMLLERHWLAEKNELKIGSPFLEWDKIIAVNFDPFLEEAANIQAKVSLSHSVVV